MSKTGDSTELILSTKYAFLLNDPKITVGRRSLRDHGGSKENKSTGSGLILINQIIPKKPLSLIMLKHKESTFMLTAVNILKYALIT